MFLRNPIIRWDWRNKKSSQQKKFFMMVTSFFWFSVKLTSCPVPPPQTVPPVCTSSRIISSVCRVGFYRSLLESSACSKCPPHSVAKQTGASTCTCEDSYYKIDSDPPNMACTREENSAFICTPSCLQVCSFLLLWLVWTNSLDQWCQILTQVVATSEWKLTSPIWECCCNKIPHNDQIYVYFI